MKMQIINQEPIEVTPDQARIIMEQVATGATIVTVGNEMVRASAISGIRNESTSESIPVSMWGQLPAGRLKNFYDDRREQPGEGYKKFQAMKRKLLNR